MYVFSQKTNKQTKHLNAGSSDADMGFVPERAVGICNEPSPVMHDGIGLRLSFLI